MAVVLEGKWSDGQSKAETDDKTMPHGADWSDGQSIIIVDYEAAAGGWAHKFCGITSPGKVNAVLNANIGKICGVAA